MHCFLLSPGHQQPLHWQCKIGLGWWLRTVSKELKRCRYFCKLPKISIKHAQGVALSFGLYCPPQKFSSLPLTWWPLGNVVEISTLNMLNCFKRCIHISYHILDCLPQEITKFIHNRATLVTLQVAYPGTYPILSIPCLLMPWWLNEPGH